MYKISILSISLLFVAVLLTHNADSKSKGDKCFSDSECGFGLECNDGVCVKEKAFDFGSSGKTGKPCNVDSDCIGSGSCEKNSFGKGYCSGN
ncbi:MAG TPA: hypothetical protein PK926_06270 [Spirochaetota bacterium]|nr:hypothetical protein [Spirochaetota bacterium]HPI89093.1 hypothetical protein [Spirochaetota bacterium]HPR48696.1 hypothetical protein [Spirochaetota bacterium]